MLASSCDGTLWKAVRPWFSVQSSFFDQSQVAVMEHYGKQSDPGSLCNLRSLINRTLVDKAAKTFSNADESVVHAFKVHLLAAICTHLNMSSVSKPVEHESSLEWLSSTTKSVVEQCVMPK